ncbi:tripartite motif-containing protein 2-like [Ptychodera flava]|uniref:tripartite motif-containing protein 2-like n=1 Tax=Ptychodera flava TaxID=63121 RepID=UPI00396A239D
MTVREGSEMETATSTQPEMTVRDRSEIETATPTQPEMSFREGNDCQGGSEIETATPTQPEMSFREGSEIETATPTQPEMTGREGSEMETATPTQPEMTVRYGREVRLKHPHRTQPDMTGKEGSEMETATPTQPQVLGEGIRKDTTMLPEAHVAEKSVHEERLVTMGKEHQKQKKDSGGIFSKISKRIFGRKEKSDERWSRRTLKGHQGHKFKDVNGLAFHNDKLLVCDSDNNIVHILNQDYTCEKELGSFSGQFAKPFKPWSIAVSQDNLYFILDKSNVQIVVCDQNNKVIRIISLPTHSDPWCIALVKGFVIITEVNGHCVLKYSLDEGYLYKFGRQGDGHTRFQYPYFVAINSRDVIMVSDSYNDCIKCFDTQFNYLYKYNHHGNSKAQLFYPYSIAVDGADNVYVCDWNNARISIWSEDRMWGHNLFQDELSWPEYIAVTANGDRIAVVSGSYRSCNEIVVFSK